MGPEHTAEHTAERDVGVVRGLPIQESERSAAELLAEIPWDGEQEIDPAEVSAADLLARL
ncbi:MAG: hypothetical protein K8H88_06650 [Sandaracinaceae bacterium]|nr:hypothetical protein [Sandaracinaceae bacterium]